MRYKIIAVGAVPVAAKLAAELLHFRTVAVLAACASPILI
jgi:hypothetical protein